MTGTAMLAVRSVDVTVPSPYSSAIDNIRETIVARARQYKRLVIAVSLDGIAAAACALALRSAQPLLFISLLPAAVIFFFALDMRSVQLWRDTVLLHWAEGDLSLKLLAQTLRQVPNLPAVTIEGMLGSLPGWGGTEVPMPARPALAIAQSGVGQAAWHCVLARAVCWGLLAAAAGSAWIAGRPSWLEVALAIPVLWAAWHLSLRYRLKRARAALTRSWREAGIDTTAGAAWLGEINCQGLPKSLVAIWFAAPSAGEILPALGRTEK